MESHALKFARWAVDTIKLEKRPIILAEDDLEWGPANKEVHEWCWKYVQDENWRNLVITLLKPYEMNRCEFISDHTMYPDWTFYAAPPMWYNLKTL